jgi:hypothetical protein
MRGRALALHWLSDCDDKIARMTLYVPAHVDRNLGLTEGI